MMPRLSIKLLLMVYKKGREGRDEFAFMKQHLQGLLESLEAIACLKQ